MNLGQAVIIDFESLGIRGTSAVLDVAILGVDFKKRDDWTFESLRNRTLHVKFDLKEQLNVFKRTQDKDTIAWWKKQSPEVQKILYPSSSDISLSKLDDIFSTYMDESGIDFKKAMLFSRGFMDWCIVDDIYETVLNIGGDSRPYSFWNQRDMRSFQHALADNVWGKVRPPAEYLAPDVVEHSSVDDVVLDAQRMNYILTELGE